jgi:hypothetical protein
MIIDLIDKCFLSNFFKKRKLNKEYKQYINEHIANVQKAWNELQELAKNECFTFYYDDFINRQICYLIDNHDQDKYNHNIFDSYRKNFFPINEKEKKKNKKRFEFAWKYHWTNNPHHHQFWKSFDIVWGKYPQIPYQCFLIEMICDWQAMGYKFGDNAYEYYYANKDDIFIYPEWVEYLESILELYNKKKI